MSLQVSLNNISRFSELADSALEQTSALSPLFRPPRPSSSRCHASALFIRPSSLLPQTSLSTVAASSLISGKSDKSYSRLG